VARYRLKLTTLSPVHVGTAEGEIGAAEFFVKNDRVYITSENYVVDALARENLIDNFVDFFQNEPRPTLSKYLNTLTRKQRANVEKGITVRKIPVSQANSRIFTLRPQVSNAMDGRAYIPGSAIKGALRTTLLYLLCQRDDSELKRIVARLPRAKRGQKQQFAKDLDRNILQEVNLLEVKKGPNTDWLRSLHVSDAYPEEKDCTEVVPVKVVSLTDNRYHCGARGATVNVEAISPGTTLTCDVIVDGFMEKMLTRFSGGNKVFDFEELLMNLNQKFDKLIDLDRKFFTSAGLDGMVKRHEMLSKWGANFRLGWGSGLMTMTLGLLLDNAARREIRQAFYFRRSNPNFPQSRKVVVNRDSVVDTLGWINLSWERIGPNQEGPA